MQARVVSVTRGQEGCLDVIIDPDPFYPGGGGQPCDQGTLAWETGGAQGVAQVISCRKQDDRARTILDVEVRTGDLTVGRIVEATVDSDRRMALTRAHSAEHILFKSLQTVLERVKRPITVKKVDLDIQESSLFVMTPQLEWDDLIQAEALANSIIAQDLSVIERQVTRQEFISEQQGKYKDIRIKLDRIKDEFIRIIEVEGFDYSACAGTHVRSTNGIGVVYVTNCSASGAGVYELRFVTDLGVVLGDAGMARKAAGILGVGTRVLPTEVARLGRESLDLKERLRASLRDTSITLVPRMSGQRTVRTGCFSFDDKKILIEKVSGLLNVGDVAFIGNAPGTPAVSSLQLYVFSRDPEVDAGALMRALQQRFPIKGGGGKDFAAGGLADGSFEAVQEAFLAILAP